MNSVLVYSIICELANTGRIPSDGRQALFAATQQTLPFMLFPRFVLSLRELYAQELRGERGAGMSQSQHATTAHSVLFAGVSRNTDDMEIELS